MSDKPERVQLKTPRCRLSFPHLFEKRQNDMGGEPRYECSLIFDEKGQKDPRFQALKEACAKVTAEKWGQKRPGNLRSPFRDGAEKELEGYGPGTVYVSASTYRKPHCLRQDREEATPDDLYPGCYVVALVSPYAYEATNEKGAVLNRGVALGLSAVFKVADGEELGGGGVSYESARDAFADEEVTGEAPAAPSSQPQRSEAPQSVSEGMGIADDDIPF